MNPERKRPNPYVGPRPFERDQRDKFFGRDAEAQSIVSRIIANRIFLLYAQSGAGKTSLLNAQVIPSLEDEGFAPLPVVRVGKQLPETIPAQGLQNIYTFNTLMSLAGDDAAPEPLRQMTLVEYFRQQPIQHDEDDFVIPRVLIIDQFEEIFSAFPQHWDQRTAFFDDLNALMDEDDYLRVVLSIREDYIARLDPYLARLSERSMMRFRIERLNTVSALQAVTRPTVGTGRSYTSEAAEQLVAELQQIRVPAANNETEMARGEFVEPVQLQVICQSLWDELPYEVEIITQEHLKNFGNVDVALGDFYNRCIRTTVQKHRVRESRLRAWFEKALITPMNTRGMVYQAQRDTASIPPTALQTLNNLHLIRSEVRGGIPWYELTHDRLIEPIQKANEACRRRINRAWGTGIAAVLAIIFIGMALSIAYLLSSYNAVVDRWMTRIQDLSNYEAQFQPASILDANGNIIVELDAQGSVSRELVRLSDISPDFLYAVISMEDPGFYELPAPGWIDSARAALVEAGLMERPAGASGIVRQVVRQLIIEDSGQAGLSHFEETVLTAEIMNQYARSELLEIYVNNLYFGNQTYGVQAAGQFYFGEDARDLNLAQSAFLAGILSSLNAFDPVDNRESAFGQMRAVLAHMAERGCVAFEHAPYQSQSYCITLEIVESDNTTIQIAEVETRHFLPRQIDLTYPHFVQYVQTELDAILGANAALERGLTVRTTIDPRLQTVAEQSLRRTLAEYADAGITTGAVLAVDPRTGAVRAMVGSADFNDTAIEGQINQALAWNQAGTAIMPVVYTAALEGQDSAYLTPASILWDVPSTYTLGGEGSFTPVNSDGMYRGPVSVREALQNTYAVPAVKAYQFIGSDAFLSMANRLGITFRPDALFSLPSALGTNEIRLLDLVQACATLANDGLRAPLRAVVDVTQMDGTAVTLDQNESLQAISPQLAYLMQHILSDNAARTPSFGANSALTLPDLPANGTVAAIAGSSAGPRDLWTIGFTENLVVGVWLGRHDNQILRNITAIEAAAPVWQAVMQQAQQRPNAFDAPVPAGIITTRICALTGTLPPESCAALQNEIFIESQPPPPAENAFTQTVIIDTWTGLRASEFCPENTAQATFARIDDPFAIQWLNATPAGAQYAQQIGLSLPLQLAPTEACGPNTPLPGIRIASPADGTVVQGLVEILGSISAADFSSYRLELTPVTDLNNAVVIYGPGTEQQPQPGSRIGVWDTRQYPNGTYMLRLVVLSDSGGFLVRTLILTVDN